MAFKLDDLFSKVRHHFPALSFRKSAPTIPTFGIIKIIVIIILTFWAVAELYHTEELYHPRTIKNQAAETDPAGNLENEEYVAPPSYEALGRGLVYNCKGKHWACVDREAYFACRDNMKWNDSQKTQPECVALNVYATEDDCRQLQLYNINIRQKTDFCK